MNHHRNMRWVSLSLVGVLIAVTPRSSAEEMPAWAGAGKYRLLVKVEPGELGTRRRDEIPAELKIDLAGELGKLGVESLPDLSTVQVMQYQPADGSPRKFTDYAYAQSDYDRPFRWYDDSIPYEFPECLHDITRTKGKLIRTPRIRAGYFFNALGDWKSGRLAWTHTQTGDETSWYAIYFDLLKAGAEPAEVPPRGWLGDGIPRCDLLGATSTGADHCRVELDDFNDDGLIDLIIGEQYGHLLWYPNCGSEVEPKYPYCKFVFDAEGLPLDTGSAAAPKIVDWDDDGNKDLLVGTEWNRILYFRNAGNNRQRRFVYQGMLEADGRTLLLPILPLARGSSAIFKRDYYPVLETVDWDDDGDVDLLAGGYITGRIFFYENRGRQDDGTPLLNLRGPLQADGKPLNVGHWCASPCLADFDADGDLDLMSGNMPMSNLGGDGVNGKDGLLLYYENEGTKQRSEFQSREFPAQGDFPRSHLATPRAADWDDDGDLDLVVSARENIYLFENQGTRKEPRFLAHDKPLRSHWGNAPIAAGQFRDWDGDGHVDLVKNYTVRLNSGAGNPGIWRKRISVLPPGEYIAHPSGIGDDWFWPFLDDLDQDGKIDVLFGDWGGHVWFHRDLSNKQNRHFDVVGRKLKHSDGVEIKVGPIGKNLDTDFDALQGARTVLTVDDFDRDGLRDLVIGDTYGKIRYFRNEGTQEEPIFANPVEIGDLGIRLLVDAADWNGDGWPDIVGGAANGRVRVYLNNGKQAKTRFDEGVDPGLPPIMQPRILMVDLNEDGDEDLFLPSTQGACLIERSFLERGYAEAKLMAVQKK